MLIDRYILKTHIGPFVLALFVLTGIFIIQFIMQFVDHLVGKGLGLWIIAEVIITNLAWMTVLAVPMSVLIATLMAYGGMSSNNEITVMKGSGISVYRMMTAPIIFSMLLTYGLMEFNNRVLPDANHRAKTLALDIRRARPTLSLTPGIFSTEIKGYTIIVKRNYEETNELEGITIYDHTDPRTDVIITAEHGILAYSPDFTSLIFDLRNGEIHETSVDIYEEYRRVQFIRHRVRLPYEGYEFQRTADHVLRRGDRELSAGAMLARADSLKARNDRTFEQLDLDYRHHNAILFGEVQLIPIDALSKAVNGRDPPGKNPAIDFLKKNISSIESHIRRIDHNQQRINQYMVEVHKKYAIAVACFIFVLLGAPLGIMTRRGGFGVACGISLGFFLLYWACLIGGEKLADRGFISPFLGMWGANMVLLPMGIYLSVKTQKEQLIINWRRLRKITPKSWRSLEENPGAR